MQIMRKKKREKRFHEPKIQQPRVASLLNEPPKVCGWHLKTEIY